MVLIKRNLVMNKLNQWLEENCIMISFIAFVVAIFIIQVTPKTEHRQVVAQQLEVSN